MNNWRWDNLRAFRDRADRFNPQTTNSGKIERTGERFSRYSSDDYRAKIEPPSSWQHKPVDCLAVTPLQWDAIIDEDAEDNNWADPEQWKEPS